MKSLLYGSSLVAMPLYRNRTSGQLLLSGIRRYDPADVGKDVIPVIEGTGVLHYPIHIDIRSEISSDRIRRYHTFNGAQDRVSVIPGSGIHQRTIANHLSGPKGSVSANDLLGLCAPSSRTSLSEVQRERCRTQGHWRSGHHPQVVTMTDRYVVRTIVHIEAQWGTRYGDQVAATCYQRTLDRNNG